MNQKLNPGLKHSNHVLFFFLPPSIGFLTPHFCQPPPPCGAISKGGTASETPAGQVFLRHGHQTSRKVERAAANRHQLKPKRQQQHFPVLSFKTSRHLRTQTGTCSYSHPPPDLQGLSASHCSDFQAQWQGQQCQQAHLSVWAFVISRGLSWPKALSHKGTQRQWLRSFMNSDLGHTRTDKHEHWSKPLRRYTYTVSNLMWTINAAERETCRVETRNENYRHFRNYWAQLNINHTHSI